ncbi:heavy metal translocating P-type ATPase [Sulfurimonas sp.]|uniref:heavy metal translocating P-type ATPase n=1 Tax=Sulfurimonas sp. TaxID=2022749 RepID=UPI002AB012FC|nr:heavy metal translocating P-type ATPase [Sulfurimonas sp.]
MNKFNLVHKLPNRLRYKIFDISSKNDEKPLIESIQKCEGVKNARVNIRAKSLIIEINNSHIQEKIEKIITEFKVTQCDSSCRVERGEVLLSKQGLITMAGVTGAGFILPKIINAPLSIATNTPMMISGLKDLYKNGITSHVLESLAVGVSLWRKDYTAANFTSLLLEAGEYIEESTSDRSDNLLRELIRPNVEEVWIEKNGIEEKINYSLVKIGDIIIVAVGDMISIDGHIIQGEALINQSSMTGESVSVTKAYGDRVMAGTVVEEGRIKIWAEHVGDDTSAAQVTKYIQESLSSKSSSALKALKLADKLVPLTLGLSAFAYITTKDWERVAAVLQADYSCALKLATPVAFKSSLHKAGKNGIMIKNAQALENLSEADTVIFDKTGTLTTGELYVCDVISFNDKWNEKKILSLAASTEEHYFHPVAEAVVRAANEQSFEHVHHEEVEFIVAHGVTTEVNGKKVHIGSQHFLEDDEGIDFNGHIPTIQKHENEGKTILCIGYDYKLLGMITMIDTVRHNTKKTIDKLHELGIKEVIMLTGDKQQKADEVAKEIGIDTVLAELLPTQKADIVKELVANGRKVVFVGDGINDAPALVEANVGISMSKGAQIAKASADISLLKDDISCIWEAIELAQDTMKLIKSNFNITVAANTAILASATMGYINPIKTAILHNGTTVGILLNAIKGVKTEKQEFV